MQPSADPDEERERLLARARKGDARSFGDLVEPHLRELRAHGYRMLGSAADAEEAVQDTLLRAWGGLPAFAGRSSFRTWLYRIATNVCLTRIERRSRRALPADLGPAADPLASEWVAVESAWVEPYPDIALGADDGRAGPEARYELRESVELAFVAALQHLPARQRAALILRDVLGFPAIETAAVLGTTVASVTSALQRARASVERRSPARSQQTTLRSLGDARVRRLAERFADAWERGDVAAILALLTEDATFAMPPYRVWYAGRNDIARFLPIGPLRQRWRLSPVAANGQLAFGCYAWDGRRSHYVAHSIDVLTLRGERVAGVTAFLDLDGSAFDRFGLPPWLTATATPGVHHAR